MSRRSELGGNYEKPAEMYLEWASDEKSFRYYDKAQGKNVLFDPGKFLFLMERHTVKGWSDNDQSGIYANEVADMRSEHLIVKTFSGRVIASGIYSENKELINNNGGSYTKSIYAMLQDGRIVNFQLKGIALKSWMDFTQKSKARLADEWVAVGSVGEGKKGKVTFSFPEFIYATSLTSSEGEQADRVYDTLKKKMSPSARVAEAPVADKDFEDIGSIADEF